MGKAELGVAPNGRQREPKKSAKKAEGDNTAGRAVIWGDPSIAETARLFEGIETAAAAALAFEAEIAGGKIIVAACITAGGIEAFKAWPSAKQIIVGADRDEAPKDGRPPRRRGGIAAQKFAALHHSKIEVSIALPGNPDENADWLDVLLRAGVEAVRNRILAGRPYAPNGDTSDPQSDADKAEIARLARLPPLDYDRAREAAAEGLDIRVATLDKQVAAERAARERAAVRYRPAHLCKADDIRDAAMRTKMQALRDL